VNKIKRKKGQEVADLTHLVVVRSGGRGYIGRPAGSEQRVLVAIDEGLPLVLIDAVEIVSERVPVEMRSAIAPGLPPGLASKHLLHLGGVDFGPFVRRMLMRVDNAYFVRDLPAPINDGVRAQYIQHMMTTQASVKKLQEASADATVQAALEEAKAPEGGDAAQTEDGPSVIVSP